MGSPVPDVNQNKFISCQNVTHYGSSLTDYIDMPSLDNEHIPSHFEETRCSEKGYLLDDSVIHRHRQNIVASKGSTHTARSKEKRTDDADVILRKVRGQSNKRCAVKKNNKHKYLCETNSCDSPSSSIYTIQSERSSSSSEYFTAAESNRSSSGSCEERNAIETIHKLDVQVFSCSYYQHNSSDDRFQELEEFCIEVKTQLVNDCSAVIKDVKNEIIQLVKLQSSAQEKNQCNLRNTDTSCCCTIL